jgi:hypothetical protein
MVLVGLGNSSLESLLLLFEQGVIESLMKMRFPLGQVTQHWVDLFVETLERPQVVLPLFLLQSAKLEDKCQCSSSRRRTVKVIPVDGALAGFGTEDCWALV